MKKGLYIILTLFSIASKGAYSSPAQYLDCVAFSETDKIQRVDVAYSYGLKPNVFKVLINGEDYGHGTESALVALSSEPGLFLKVRVPNFKGEILDLYLRNGTEGESWTTQKSGKQVRMGCSYNYE